MPCLYGQVARSRRVAPQISTLWLSCCCFYILCPFFNVIIPGSCWPASSFFSAVIPWIMVFFSCLVMILRPKYLNLLLTICFKKHWLRFHLFKKPVVSLVFSPWHVEQPSVGPHFKRFLPFSVLSVRRPRIHNHEVWRRCTQRKGLLLTAWRLQTGVIVLYCGSGQAQSCVSFLDAASFRCHHEP